jgi:integral membrane protein
VSLHASPRQFTGSAALFTSSAALFTSSAALFGLDGRADVNAPAASRSIEHLRVAGKVEGVSYLLLLGVAMPLKYFAGLPLAVKLVGWAHGLLFVVFLIVLVLAMLRARLSFTHAASAFIASLLPFGPFLIDRRLEAVARSDGAQRAASAPSVG